MPDGPEPLAATAEADLMWIEEAARRIAEGSWEETYAYFGSLKWVKAGTIRKDSCDEELAKRAKALRDAVKKIVSNLKESYFTRKNRSRHCRLFRFGALCTPYFIHRRRGHAHAFRYCSRLPKSLCGSTYR